MHIFQCTADVLSHHMVQHQKRPEREASSVQPGTEVSTKLMEALCVSACTTVGEVIGREEVFGIQEVSNTWSDFIPLKLVISYP